MLNKLHSEVNNYSKISKQFIVNVFLQMTSSFLPIAVLQLFVYPRIAEELGGDKYGLMLTIYSVWFFIAAPISDAINNSLIVNNNKYKDGNARTDFSILSRRWLFISSILCLIVTYYYDNSISVLSLALRTIISIFIFLSNYLECYFKIDINYIRITINKSIISLGFIIGYGLFIFTKKWEFIFVFGYGFSVLFCLLTLKNNKIGNKTEYYSVISKDCSALIFPSIINGAIGYADKLVLYPLLGGLEVSIYYVATLIGKVTSIISGAIREVTLSYLSRTNKNKKKLVVLILVCGIPLVCIAYAVILIFSRFIISFLYPQWVEQVIKLIPITTIAAMVEVLNNVIYPFSLKNCDRKWQIVFSVTSALAYFISSLLLMKLYGIYGFCIGNVIGQLVKLLLMIFVYFNNVNNIKQ